MRGRSLRKQSEGGRDSRDKAGSVGVAEKGMTDLRNRREGARKVKAKSKVCGLEQRRFIELNRKRM